MFLNKVQESSPMLIHTSKMESEAKVNEARLGWTLRRTKFNFHKNIIPRKVK